MELRIIWQVELIVSEPVWIDAYVDLLYVPKVSIVRRKKCTWKLNLGY